MDSACYKKWVPGIFPGGYRRPVRRANNLTALTCRLSSNLEAWTSWNPQGLCGDCFRLQLKCDGTRWRTGGAVKGKLVNGVGSQYSSHYLGTWCIQHYYRRCPHLPLVGWTDAPAYLNGLVGFAERRDLVSARVPSHFNWPLPSFLRGTGISTH